MNKRKAQRGFGYEMPPDRQLVDIYFDQKGFAAQAALFYTYYREHHWRSPRGTPFRNWKVLASDWLFNHQQTQKLRQRLKENQLQ
ncbi:MAG: hypothetical protein ABI367_14695 [Mucilaginibacter sp.]